MSIIAAASWTGVAKPPARTQEAEPIGVPTNAGVEIVLVETESPGVPTMPGVEIIPVN